MVPLVGDVSLATEFALLKRDLARGHNVLGSRPSETNYQSIICLVESALTGLKLKQLDRPQLDTIRQALEIGYRKVHVSVAYLEGVRELFRNKQVDVMPRIDLLSFTPEELADENE